jgi:hypothetical protein
MHVFPLKRICVLANIRMHLCSIATNTNAFSTHERVQMHFRVLNNQNTNQKQLVKTEIIIVIYSTTSMHTNAFVFETHLYIRSDSR